MTRILIVEPNDDDRMQISEQLVSAGFDAATAVNGQTALAKLQERAAELVITNWNLPDLSGAELLARLRSREEIPELRVLVLARNPDGRAAAQALEQGADDFFAKPASDEELIARVRVAMRRKPIERANGTYQVGPVRLEKLTHRVSVGDEPIELAPVEYRLMAYFMEHPGRVHDRQHLLERVWGRRAGIGERTVDVHVRRLRALLEPHGCSDLLQTVRGFGYRFGS